jgi:hypothetical protein
MVSHSLSADPRYLASRREFILRVAGHGGPPARVSRSVCHGRESDQRHGRHRPGGLSFELVFSGVHPRRSMPCSRPCGGRTDPGRFLVRRARRNTRLDSLLTADHCRDHTGAAATGLDRTAGRQAARAASAFARVHQAVISGGWCSLDARLRPRLAREDRPQQQSKSSTIPNRERQVGQ